MSRSDAEEDKSVALYWDFENLHASLSEARLGEGWYGKPDGRFKPQEPLIDVQAIVELASSFGPIAINPHGYANFPAMVKALDALIEVRKGESDQVISLR